MEFNAYIGRAGTGKSHRMISEIKAKMAASPLGDPIILIAPTQSTFQLEQAFINDPTLYGSLRTEVLHFERLSHRIFQEVGGLTETRLSKSALEMMIYDLLQQHQQELKRYRSQVKYYGLSEKLRDQIQDLKRYDVSAEQLQAYIAENELSTRTRHKLQDIAHIYQALENRMAGTYVTPEDSLSRFIDMIPSSEWLKRAEIYIDGFHNFSTLEYQMIEALVKQAKRVTVLLTTTGDKDAFSMFRKPSESLQHLENIADTINTSLHIERFTTPQRFASSTLAHLEHDFDALQRTPYNADTSIELLEAKNMREEVNDIARQILKEVREQGRRYQDIAILYRDPSYTYLFESVFPQYDIPFYTDTKMSMTYHPVMEMFRALIEVMRSGWQFEPMMRLFKTHMLSTRYDDATYLVDLLENYVLERGIYGKRWLDPAYFDIEKFSRMGIKNKPLSDEERATFERVIQLKDDVLRHIVHFEHVLHEVNQAEDYATAFYSALERAQLPEHLMTERDKLNVDGKHEEAEKIDQIWRGFIQVLDDMVRVFEQRDMSLNHFLELLDIGLDQLEFVMIPQTLDQVSIGTMDLAKVDNKAHVYLVGMNDGVMPQSVSASNLITDDEKAHFSAHADVLLSPTADVLQMDEAFVCYIALTRAKAQVTCSYSLMGLGGEAREMSPLLQQIMDCFNHLDVRQIEKLNQQTPLRLIEHPHQTKTLLFEALRAWLDDEIVSDIWSDVYQVMHADTSTQSDMSYLRSALTFDNATVQLDGQLTTDLYGKTMHASVSRFEGYQQCAFKHFASHGLKLNERTKYKLQNFDLGDIFHAVLKYISEEIAGQFAQLNNTQIQQLTSEALQRILPHVQFQLLNSTAYYRYISQRIGAIVQATLQALKYQGTHTQFKPHAFETSFRRNPKKAEELRAEAMATRQGIPIYIRGQIDRIDTYTEGQESFVNIIDYKSSDASAKLDLTKVYHGIQMQMMTYMDIVLQNAERLGLSEEVRPGGMLYFHVHEAVARFKNWSEIDDAAREAQRIKSYKMSGLLNQDIQTLEAYDQRLEPKFTSDVMPIGLTAKGAIAKRGSQVADEDTIYKFIQRNKMHFIDTATHIMDGHTEVAPLKYKDRLPCEFCNYRSVCHVDGTIDSKRYRTVDEHIDPIAAIQELEDDDHDTDETK